MGKLLHLPKPVDDQGHELSPEEVEELSQEPFYVPVTMVHSRKKVTYYMACDFDQVERDADQTYQMLKTSFLASAMGIDEGSSHRRNSKFTHLKEKTSVVIPLKKDNETEEEKELRETAEVEARQIKEEEERSFAFLQVTKSIELRPQHRECILNIMFPKDGTKVILGHNIPNLPSGQGEDNAALKEKLAHGGKTSDLVLDAVITAYDPTNPFARLTNAITMTEDQLTEQTEILGNQSLTIDQSKLDLSKINSPQKPDGIETANQSEMENQATNGVPTKPELLPEAFTSVHSSALLPDHGESDLSLASSNSMIATP